MKYLAIIPARGGSKGLPNKNIKLLAGKPLIQHSIDAARAIFDDVDICVSTEDEQIRAVALKTGIEIPYVRPTVLATDTATSLDVVNHALQYYKAQGKTYDAIVLLQPTSPLRTSKHIEQALKLYSNELDMVVSVFETNSNPYYVLFEENENGYLKKSKKGSFTRRQDCPNVWEYNGAIYIINTKSLQNANNFEFEKIVKFQMNAEDSVDIDNALDLKFAEFLLQNRE